MISSLPKEDGIKDDSVVIQDIVYGLTHTLSSGICLTQGWFFNLFTKGCSRVSETCIFAQSLSLFYFYLLLNSKDVFLGTRFKEGEWVLSPQRP